MDPGAGDDLSDEFDLDVSAAASGDDVDQDTSVVVQELTKKRKRSAEKAKARKKRNVDASKDGENGQKIVATQSPAVQAEYIKSLQHKVYKDASDLELVELCFSESCFLDTRSYSNKRMANDLPAFITEVAPNLQARLGQRPANKGAPTMLVLSSSALRAAELVRVLRPMSGKKGGEVAKLFAKHFKLEQHAEYLRRTTVSAGVGTTGRIGKLLGETDSLSLKALTHVLIDASHQDAKTMTIFDIAEIRSSLLREVLGNPDLKKSIDSGKTKIILF